MACHAFFRSPGGANADKLSLIALELAEYYHVDPDVMMAKRISHLLWLKSQTLKLAEMQAEAKRRAQED